MRNMLLIFSIVLFLASGCRKEKFTSESEWVLPLLDTRLTLADVIPDSLTSYNPDSSLNIVFQKQYGISNLSDIVQVPDRVETMEVSLSNLTLDDRAFTDTLTLKEIYPASIFLDGQYTELEAQHIQPNEGTVVDVTDQFFTQATFLEGFIDITIHNDLPVEAELLEFELRNNDDKEVIVDGAFYNLAPFDSVSESYSLAGKTVDGVMEMLVQTVKTKASDGAVQIDVSKGLRIAFAVRGLKPQKATAIFPAQNLVERKEETKYDFGGAELTQIFVKEGDIILKVESSIEEAIIIQYKIPNSTTGVDNKSVVKTWTVPAAEPGKTVNIEERFPIDGITLYLWGESNNKQPNFNHIYNEIIASIEYSGIERTLSLDDKIKIEAGLVDLKPQLVIGDPGYHKLATSDTLEVDFLKKISGNIGLENVTIDFNLFNSFGIENDIEIEELIGINTRNGSTVKLDLYGVENPIKLERAVNGLVFEPAEKKVSFSKENSNIKQFIENLPDVIIPQLTTTVRPRGTLYQSDFAFDTSSLRADVSITVPMQVSASNLTFKTIDSLTIFKNENFDNIESVVLIILVENDFPLDGVLDLNLLDSDGAELLTGFEEDLKTMLAAEVDDISGKTVAPMSSLLEYRIDGSQLINLKNTEQLLLEIALNSEGSKRYKMYSDYGVHVEIKAEIVYKNEI